MHHEILSYSATAPGAAGAAAAASVGDSLTIKNCHGNAQVAAFWANNQVEGFHQLIVPSGHDTTRNWRTMVEAVDITPRNVLGVPWEMEPQEAIAATISGSATAGDIETGHLLMFYKNLPGTDARLITWEQLLERLEPNKQVTVQASITATAAGGYTGAELINADSDLLQANRDYALLGIETATPCGAVCISGPDTGNVRTGVPGNSLRPDLCGNFFATLARAYAMPFIPVINSGNKASTTLTVNTNENGGATLVSLNFCLLKRRTS
jgi:hypothetical protein